MNLKQLEILWDLSTKLEYSLTENNTSEKEIIIVKLKDVCLSIRLENASKEYEIINHENLRCSEDCEQCVVNKNSNFLSYLMEEIS